MMTRSGHTNDDRGPGGGSGPILVILSDGPRSQAEIEDAFRGYGRRLPGDPRGLVGSHGEGTRLGRSLEPVLAQAVASGWANPPGDGDRFSLTAAGRVEADRVLGDLHARRERRHRLLNPAIAATNTMAAQIAVTAVKVPAALISGSIAQLNDAIEEILDVIASVTLSVGLRLNRERLANYVVVALMVATGVFALVLAIHRLFVPARSVVSWYPLTVAALSVPFYAIRSAYERDAGVHGGSAALVSQSVDSRNHALVGIGVTIGLISSALGAGIIDTLIGLGLAIAILKSGAVLAHDLVRSLRSGEEPDVSRYSPWVSNRLERAVTSRLEIWMLYLVESEQVTVRGDLLGRLGVALRAETNPLLREYGMEFDASALAVPALDELIRRQLIGSTEPLVVTGRGRRILDRAVRHRL